MKELNLLTRRLFDEGWTREKHPDYVRDCFTADLSTLVSIKTVWCFLRHAACW